MKNTYFWSIIKRYNELMSTGITGPNCIDPKVCHGDCCSIKIDIPKVLAEEYINQGYATKEDFIRNDIFSFHLRFDEKTGKCFLFEKDINGCKVHNSGIKPPQCWIYPTKFSNPNNIEISCKRATGWKIINPAKTEEAEKLLKKFIFLSQIEARKEKNEILNRCLKKPLELKQQLRIIAPSQLGGFKDTWDSFRVLSAEGLSLQMNKFCLRYNQDCDFALNNFIKCKRLCKVIIDKLYEFLLKNIQKFIQAYGLDTEGEYPLYKLFEFFKE